MKVLKSTFGDTPLARILSPRVFNFDASKRNVRCLDFARSSKLLGPQRLAPLDCAHLTAAHLCDTFNRRSAGRCAFPYKP